jgi:hypothetical protein
MGHSCLILDWSLMPLYPGAIWRGPVPNVGGSMGVVRLGVVHIMQGTMAGTDATFKNPANEVSAHFGNPKDGTEPYQWVDTAVVAWAEAAYNGEAISIEHEGDTGDSLTTGQFANDVDLVRWLAANGGPPIRMADGPDDPLGGWIGHGELGIAGGNHPDCPGAPILAQWPAVLAAAQPTPSPQEAHMAVAPAISFGGQKHVFGCPGGKGLQHAWSADGKTWHAEDLFTAAGLGTPSIPNQEPGVSLVDSQLTVTCEDSTGRAWYFVFIGGKWGVAELPAA